MSSPERAGNEFRLDLAATSSVTVTVIVTVIVIVTPEPQTLHMHRALFALCTIAQCTMHSRQLCSWWYCTWTCTCMFYSRVMQRLVLRCSLCSLLLTSYLGRVPAFRVRRAKFQIQGLRFGNQLSEELRLHVGLRVQVHTCNYSDSDSNSDLGYEGLEGLEGLRTRTRDSGQEHQYQVLFHESHWQREASHVIRLHVLCIVYCEAKGPERECYMPV